MKNYEAQRNITALFASLDVTTGELLQLASSLNEETINTVPFKDSWTAAQVADHVAKSTAFAVSALEAPGKETERPPNERAEELKAIFLDFTTKLKSPGFIVPTQPNYKKETVLLNLKLQLEKLNTIRNITDLSTLTSLPALGEITKLELLYFVLYHTQRHVHQLKKILQAIKSY